MANGSKDTVMLGRRQLVDQRTAPLPGGSHTRHVENRILRQRCQHHLALAIEVGPGRRSAAVFGAGNRVCRHELADALTEGGTRRSNHIGFRAAAVGHHSICPEVGCDAGHDLAHLADRRRDQNKIGISHFLARIDPESIDDAEFKRLRQGRDAAAKADHFLDFACCLECQRKRTANQADAEDDDLAELR